MKFYIALGGIGYRIVRAYAEKNNLDKSACYYMDVTTDVLVNSEADAQIYRIKHLSGGTGTLRQIGKRVIRYEIYSNRLHSFFEGILSDDNPEVTIVTSSFGGFGSSAAMEIAEYLEALLFEKNRSQHTSTCRILAFNEAYFKNFGFPEPMLERFRFNTIETAGEFSAANPVSGTFVDRIADSPIFNPVCSTYLIDTACLQENDFYRVLDKSNEELQKLDVKGTYSVKIKKGAPDVFISYSSLDQKIADMLVDKLEENGIKCWIATRNIHEGSYARQIIQGIRGAKIFVVLISKNSIASEQVKNEIDRAFARLKDNLKIVPFIIDEAELDDECSYYLCRQEFFFGKRPPVTERIQELVLKIQDMLE